MSDIDTITTQCEEQIEYIISNHSDIHLIRKCKILFYKWQEQLKKLNNPHMMLLQAIQKLIGVVDGIKPRLTPESITYINTNMLYQFDLIILFYNDLNQNYRNFSQEFIKDFLELSSL